MWLIILWIPSSAQDTTKPYCLTPDQRRFVLKQAYRLQECDSVLSSYKIQLNDARNVIRYDAEQMETMEDQLNAQKDVSAQRLRDLAFVTNELHLKNKKVKWLRIGVFSVSAAAIIELGYIAIKR